MIPGPLRCIDFTGRAANGRACRSEEAEDVYRGRVAALSRALSRTSFAVLVWMGLAAEMTKAMFEGGLAHMTAARQPLGRYQRQHRVRGEATRGYGYTVGRPALVRRKDTDRLVAAGRRLGRSTWQPAILFRNIVMRDGRGRGRACRWFRYASLVPLCDIARREADVEMRQATGQRRAAALRLVSQPSPAAAVMVKLTCGRPTEPPRRTIHTTRTRRRTASCGGRKRAARGVETAARRKEARLSTLALALAWPPRPPRPRPAWPWLCNENQRQRLTPLRRPLRD